MIATYDVDGEGIEDVYQALLERTRYIRRDDWRLHNVPLTAYVVRPPDKSSTYHMKIMTSWMRHNTVFHLIHRSDVALGDGMAAAFLDHGNHFGTTWEVKGALEERFDVAFDTYEPESSYEELVEEHGARVNERKPELCCGTLQSEPVERIIEGHDGWLTGYRIEESIGGDGESYDWRGNLDFFEEKDDVVRVNPIVHWTADEIWEYHRRHDIPYNDLYDQGFDCIGCKQCTLDGEALFAVDSLRNVGEASD